MRILNSCPVCNSNDNRILVTYKFKNPGINFKNYLTDYKNLRLWILFYKILDNPTSAKFNITLCKSCGFIFLNPRFSEDDFKIKYSIVDKLKSERKFLKKNPMYNLDNRAQRVYKLINKYYDQNSRVNPKILDYGGAWGYILNPFINKFKCYIIDYNKWKLVKQIKYLGKDLISLKIDFQFDIILLLHTLEHVINPKEFLDDLCKYLQKDGIIYIEVPLGCLKEWKTLREPLTHINFFSEESLTKLSSLCNLNVLHIDTSYQWVTHGKKWCINMIGTKSTEGNFINLDSILSTKAQMSKFYYKFQDFINLRNYPIIMKDFIKNLRNKFNN